MSLFVQISSQDVQEQFYDSGAKGDLPTKWEAFKIEIVGFCIGESLENLKRYNNEPWSKYLKRLKDSSIPRKNTNEKLLKFIRKHYLPKNLLPLFYANTAIEKAIIRISEIESFNNYHAKKEKKDTI